MHIGTADPPRRVVEQPEATAGRRLRRGHAVKGVGVPHRGRDACEGSTISAVLAGAAAAAQHLTPAMGRAHRPAGVESDRGGEEGSVQRRGDGVEVDQCQPLVLTRE